MQISHVRLTEKSEKLVLVADITFQGKKAESMYFSTDKKFESFLVSDASPFLAAILIPCMKTKENIAIDGRISEKQLENADKLMDLLVSWKLGFKKVLITAKEITKDDYEPQHVATFFSAGVDSFYTYLQHNKGVNRIDHFILVHGFDIPLENPSFFNEVKETVKQIATDENVTPIFVKTNITDIVEKRLVWDFAHGGALAAVGLMFRKKLKTIYIPGAVRKDELFPYGTHPHLDPLWSTEQLTFFHDGNEHNRLGKVMHGIAHSPLALKYLRVCTQNIKGKYNCSHCYKCLQTMIELVCANAADKAITFEWPIDLEAVSNMYYDYDLKYNIQGEVNLAILEKENRELALQKAIKESLEKSKHPKLSKRVYKVVAAFDQKYNDRRLYRLDFKMNGKQDRNVVFKYLIKKGILK